MKEEKKRMAVEAMGLPKDVLLGDVLVRFTGFHEVCIENYSIQILWCGSRQKPAGWRFMARIWESGTTIRTPWGSAATSIPWNLNRFHKKGGRAVA